MADEPDHRPSKATRRVRRDLSIAPWVAVLLLGFGILIFYLISLNFYALPTPLLRADDPRNEFIAERARDMLVELNDIGHKVVGSEANEVLTPAYLQRKFEELSRDKNPVHQLEFSHTTHSGSFERLVGAQSMIASYQNIGNVQFRISRADGRSSGAALLINTHYDTYPGSPGISDAAVMVAVALEAARVLLQSDAPYRHDIVFLFNGAEEAGLKGSHAFITQHPWRHNITALLNLDSTGAGGKEVLFQAGPNSPWLAAIYAKFVKYPFASALGEELFQFNLVPSDTDFRIFRDFGGVKGLDLAHINNGFVYHTKYDNLENVPLGTIQHTGDNVLALAKGMADSVELDLDAEHADDQAVFFDFLHWFAISYSRVVAIIVNLLIALYSLKFAMASVRGMCEASEYPFAEGLKEFFYMVLMQAGSAIIGVGLAVLMAVIYDACGRSMSYYSNPWLLFGLYYLPFIVGLCVGPLVYFRVDPNKTMDRHYLLQMWMHANAFLLTLVLFLLTFFGVRSAFLILIPVVFYAFTMTLNMVTGWQKKFPQWLCVTAAGQIFPFFFFCHLSLMALVTFIPMQGRSGASMNPDLIICAFCFIMAWMLAGFITPLIGFMRKDLWVWGGMFVLIVATIIMIATPLGFPYKSETAPQRHFVMHTKRNFFDINGNLAATDNGFFLYPMDRHSHPDYLQSDMEVMANVQPADLCLEYPFCAMPVNNVRHLRQVNNSYWIPSNSAGPDIDTDVQRIVNGVPENRLMFQITGPSRWTLTLIPIPRVEIVRWSFSDKVADTGLDFYGRKTYFITHSAGSPAPVTFWIDIALPEGDRFGELIDLAVVAHRNEQLDSWTEEFTNFVASFPEWCHVTAWEANYNWYRF